MALAIVQYIILIISLPCHKYNCTMNVPFIDSMDKTKNTTLDQSDAQAFQTSVIALMVASSLYYIQYRPPLIKYSFVFTVQYLRP